MEYSPYKDASYAQKLIELQHWMPMICHKIRKDLRQNHLQQDILFVKKYLQGKTPQKITDEELAAGYVWAIKDSEPTRADEIAEFICQHWLLKHTDVYYFFAEELGKLQEDFAQLEKIEDVVANDIMHRASAKFSPILAYLFCVINSVAYSASAFKQFAQQAIDFQKQSVVQAKDDAEKASVEDLKNHYEEKIARLTDKYEKKLAGMEKKYGIDTSRLKQQVATFQRKLSQ